MRAIFIAFFLLWTMSWWMLGRQDRLYGHSDAAYWQAAYARVVSNCRPTNVVPMDGQWHELVPEPKR